MLPGPNSGSDQRFGDWRTAAAAAEVRRLASAHWSAAIIQAAAQLGLPDAVGDEPTSIDEIAAATGFAPDRVLRLMRALAAQGFFVHVGDQRFAHTSFSRTLRSDCPLGVRNLTLLGGSEWNWAAWGGLANTVRTGVPAFIARYGKDLYSYFAEDAPDAGVIFNRSMSESGRWTSGPVADALDVTGLKTVADIGGGEGGLLRVLLERHRNLRGVLVDSEHVVGQADRELRDGALAARCEIVPADIRSVVPCVADLYVLRQVMHIWDDDTCVRILRNCVANASPGARIVLVEHLINDDPEQKPTPAFTTQIDLLMMLIGQGRERTGEDFAGILTEAGLEFRGITATPLPLHLITGVLPG